VVRLLLTVQTVQPTVIGFDSTLAQGVPVLSAFSPGFSPFGLRLPGRKGGWFVAGGVEEVGLAPFTYLVLKFADSVLLLLADGLELLVLSLVVNLHD
jgi:hypothetical protein